MRQCLRPGGRFLIDLNHLPWLLANFRETMVVERGRTTVPHLWAAGDCAWRNGEGSPGGQVIAAMAAGVER